MANTIYIGVTQEEIYKFNKVPQVEKVEVRDDGLFIYWLRLQKKFSYETFTKQEIEDLQRNPGIVEVSLELP